MASEVVTSGRYMACPDGAGSVASAKKRGTLRRSWRNTFVAVDGVEIVEVKFVLKVVGVRRQNRQQKSQAEEEGSFAAARETCRFDGSGALDGGRLFLRAGRDGPLFVAFSFCAMAHCRFFLACGSTVALDGVPATTL